MSSFISSTSPFILKSCPPDFCTQKRNSISAIDPTIDYERLDKALLHYWNANKYIIYSKYGDTANPLHVSLSDSISDISVHSPENNEKLKNFIENSRWELENFISQSRGFDTVFITLLGGFAKELSILHGRKFDKAFNWRTAGAIPICLHDLVALLPVLESFPVAIVPTLEQLKEAFSSIDLVSYIPAKKRAAQTAHILKFSIFTITASQPQVAISEAIDMVSGLLVPMIEEVVKKNKVEFYFDFINSIGGLRSLNQSHLVEIMYQSNVEVHLGSRKTFSVVAQFYQYLAYFLRKTGRSFDDLPLMKKEYWDKLKLEADQNAKAKEWMDALGKYSLIAEFSPADFTARANSAACRIILAELEEDNYHYHYAISDCTYALELSPNHVKAHYRRGLALAGLKMWSKAILDFERAVELDDRSPAKASLVIARRELAKSQSLVVI